MSYNLDFDRMTVRIASVGELPILNKRILHRILSSKG